MDDLLLALGDERKPVRMDAIERLRAQLPDVTGWVLAALSSEKPLVRAGACAVLDHAEQDATVEAALRAATSDRDARVRDAAFHSLSCGHCKPDGCLASDAVDLLVDALLHEPTIRVRRKLAGGLMWGQQGRSLRLDQAFRTILDTETDGVLRDRAAIYLASGEVPRGDLPHREWYPVWHARCRELLAS